MRNTSLLTAEASVLLAILRLGGRARATDIVNNVEYGPKAVYRALKDLILTGHVKKVNGVYEITEKGKRALEKLKTRVMEVIA